MTYKNLLDTNEKVLLEGRGISKDKGNIFGTLFFAVIGAAACLAGIFADFEIAGKIAMTGLGGLFFVAGFYAVITYSIIYLTQPQIPLVLTDKSILFFKRDRFIKVSLDGVLRWKHSIRPGQETGGHAINNGTFLFHTTTGDFKVKYLDNFKQLAARLHKLMPERCENTYNNFGEDLERPAEREPIKHSSTKAYFDSILREVFNYCEIKENVPARKIDLSAADARPYTYVLYRMGRPVAAIMLTDGGGDKTRAYRAAKEACQKAYVPFFNFFTHFANEREYVINRLKRAL